MLTRALQLFGSAGRRMHVKTRYVRNHVRSQACTRFECARLPPHWCTLYSPTPDQSPTGRTQKGIASGGPCMWNATTWSNVATISPTQWTLKFQEGLARLAHIRLHNARDTLRVESGYIVNPAGGKGNLWKQGNLIFVISLNVPLIIITYSS